MKIVERLVSGIVGLFLATVASALWGGFIGFLFCVFQGHNTHHSAIWHDVIGPFAVAGAITTFLWETPIASWVFEAIRAMNASTGSGLMGLTLAILSACITWPMILARLLLSFIPVKLLSYFLVRSAEKARALCEFAGVVIAVSEVQVDGAKLVKDQAVFTIGLDWKLRRNDRCWGWVDRLGRVYQDATAEAKIIDPDLEPNVHPAGVIVDNMLVLANVEIGRIRRT